MSWKSDFEKDIIVIKKIVLDYFYTHKRFPKSVTHKNVKYLLEYHDMKFECAVYHEDSEYKKKNMITTKNFLVRWADKAKITILLKQKK